MSFQRNQTNVRKQFDNIKKIIRTVGGELSIVTKFCERIEEMVKTTVTTEIPSELISKSVITFFSKI